MPPANTIDLFTGPFGGAKVNGPDQKDTLNANFEIFGKLISNVSREKILSAEYGDAYHMKTCRLHVGIGATLIEKGTIHKSLIGFFEGIDASPPLKVQEFIVNSLAAFTSTFLDNQVFIGTYPQWQGFSDRHEMVGEQKNPLNEPIAGNGVQLNVGQVFECPYPIEYRVGDSTLALPLTNDLFAYHEHNREEAVLAGIIASWTQVAFEGATALSEQVYFLFNESCEEDVFQAQSIPFREPARLDPRHMPTIGYAPPMTTIFGMQVNGLVDYLSFMFSPSTGSLLSIRRTQSPTTWAKILRTSPIVRELFNEAGQ